MKKILFINTVYEGGGAAKIARELFLHLNKQDNFSAFFAYGRGKSLGNPKIFKFGNKLETIIHVFLVRFLGLEGYGCYFATKKLIRFIRKKRIEIVHLHNLHGYYINFFQLIAFLKKRKIEVIWTLHDEWLMTWLPAYSMGCNHCRTLKGHCTNRYDYPKNYFPLFSHYLLKKKIDCFSKDWDPLIVCPANWLLNSLKNSPFANLNALVINNGINTNTFHVNNNKTKLRALYKLPTDKKIILFVANSLKQKIKGINYVLKVAKQLTNNKYLFLGLGNGNINTKNNIKLIPYLKNKNEVAEVMSLADVLCFPSAIEVLPLTVLESLACGLPVVAFNIPATKEIMTNDIGRLVDYGSTEELTKSIKTILDNDNLRKNMSIEARNTAVKYFSQDIMFDNYLKVYNEF